MGESFVSRAVLNEGLIFLNEQEKGIRVNDLMEFTTDGSVKSSLQIPSYGLEFESLYSYDFEMKYPHRLKRFKKTFNRFTCKGPARYRALKKWQNLQHKHQIIVRKWLNLVFGDAHTHDYNSLRSCINITGLPCTDALEFIWMNMFPNNYGEYHLNKRLHTERSRTRIKRKTKR